MSFRQNSSQQLSFSDSFATLTAREKKALENSWAKVFADEIFPAIDERPFSVLYSGQASRPNTPTNVIIGALIIKELFDYTDDEMVENLMLDHRLQYALHTTSFEEQPLSDKTLSRFRKRCYEYECLHNKDLLHDCINNLSACIAKLMGVSGKIKRMDSMMIESNIRRLSRFELIYACISRYVSYLCKQNDVQIPENLAHYADPEDFNRVVYHQRNSDAYIQMEHLLKDADALLDLYGSQDCIEYELLSRCLSEQTIKEDSVRRLRTKEDETMDSSIMQNPHDPEATYRIKGGKAHIGYAANLEESVSENGSIVTDYQYEQNNYSDSRFLKNSLENTEVQNSPTVLIADGAYSGTENAQLAAEKNIKLVTTNLAGKVPDDIFADFKFSQDGKTVLKCPAGNTPKSCSFVRQSGQCLISFNRELCANCPNQAKCKPKIFKRVAKISISKTAKERAMLRRKISSDEFKVYARLRNGIETVPSNLRKNYRLDKLPRGKQRGKFFFGCKIAALNFKKFFNYLKGLCNYAENHLLTA